MTDFDRIFNPRRLAVIGVSADKKDFGFGIGILRSLLHIGFEGAIYPVNPKGGEVYGLKIYRQVEDIPETIDFAIIAVAARLVPQALESCRQKGAAGAEILSSGFREAGTPEGDALDEEVRRVAQKGIRVIGPNCFGVYCPKSGLTFLPGPDLSREPGDVAFVSQSGGMAVDFASVGKWSSLKFSRVVSFGNGMDIRESELLSFLEHDPETRVIAMYIEGIENGDRFFDALRSAAARKPVVVIKGGLSEAGSRAVASHTASMGGKRTIWQAVLKQAGAVQVADMRQMVQACLGFSLLPWREYKNISVVGGGGALGVAACDAAESFGLNIPVFDPALRDRILPVLPRPGSSAANPVDVANPFVPPDRLKQVLLLAAQDDRIDAQVLTQLLDHYKVLALGMEGVSLEALVPYRELADAVDEVVKTTGKPVLMVMPNNRQGIEDIDIETVIRHARKTFRDKGIPVFENLADALFALSKVSGFAARNKQIHLPDNGPAPAALSKEGAGNAAKIIDAALAEGRETLTEHESKNLLAGFGIPVTRELLVHDGQAAVSAARTIGYPVAVKGCAPAFAHKTEADLIRLNIRDDAELQDACAFLFSRLGNGGGLLVQEMIKGRRELVAGMSRDDPFGPCVMFGLGGIFTEILGDVAFRKAPLSRNDAMEMIKDIRGSRVLEPVRGFLPVDREALADILVTVGRIAVNDDRIREIDINPLIVDGSRPVAVDALVVLTAGNKSAGSGPP
ncbi:MAG: acetate--CoA ligase family protein [Thermodesulfobacteriota bacterium]